jgi:hypothetical protein
MSEAAFFHLASVEVIGIVAVTAEPLLEVVRGDAGVGVMKRLNHLAENLEEFKGGSRSGNLRAEFLVGFDSMI